MANQDTQWIIIDSRVFDLSSFASLHPGGQAVLLDPEIAGQDATERFFELHRSEVLHRYARLQIGIIEGEEPQIKSHVPGALSAVPYAEPTWLSPGYHSPYYKEVFHLSSILQNLLCENKIVEDALSGKKPICLAVTEAFAGSDVQGLRCKATRTKEGWIVNGTKKWITNAMWAHYFVVACKAESGEIVILVVERGEGVQTKPIRTAYSSSSAGTAFVTFDSVRVPPENQLGAGHPGLNIILANFNHERWVLTAATIGGQRLIFEECLKWATQRKVFGKPLSSQPVIRQKLAAMISRVESCQSWIENITFQMCTMSAKEQARHLAGQMSLLKMHATRASQATAADAVQIFGGRGITQTGMGRFIEHYHRTLLIDAVGGGAEDVLADLGIRQAIRIFSSSSIVI
ncbi:Acyl-CoA dehydrogenase [Mycena sanguinolenta]|uniref:Acyl-CoA dehydrogenase n=1 Tax=Mycena sanguinolenta TaxID=230812 RepID=A0A8H6ZCG1_9AGAR|nr:Acyl-CoA dehydrogenase [Mycena sanguinolenta]